MTYDKDSFLAGLSVGILLGREYHAKYYLTFESEDSSDFTLSVYNSTKKWNGTLYYSTDTVSWSVWNGTTILNSNNGVLYLRGTGNTKITDYSNIGDNRWVLSTGKRIRCIGNIECLLDWETVKSGQHPPMTASCYSYMFSGCTSLVSAPDLPATTLEGQCYDGMFYNCTSLVSAPALPATTLANWCYRDMFRGCTSLMSAPELPATTITSRCYDGMFRDCTSLVSASALPATALADYCYQNMFYNCTSLASAPDLPATTLTLYCYNLMFRGCTSLVNAPALPATTLANGCYRNMFYGCTSLVRAPELPATTLETECYQYMFYGCSHLKLSKSRDATYQYAYRIPTSGTGTTGYMALYQMFYNTGGTFTGTPTINTTYYTDHPPIPAT